MSAEAENIPDETNGEEELSISGLEITQQQPEGQVSEAEGVPQVEREDGVQLEGECQWFHFQKGFGFIHKCSDGGEPVYVNFRDIVGYQCLVPGQKVQFKYRNGQANKKGTKGRAEDVRAPGGGDIRNHASQRVDQFKNRLASLSNVRLGYCKWYDESKRYGFITPVEGGDDIFAHSSSFNIAPLSGTRIPPGIEVEFELYKEEGKDKMRAININAPGGGPLNLLGRVPPLMPYMLMPSQERPAPGGPPGGPWLATAPVFNPLSMFQMSGYGRSAFPHAMSHAPLLPHSRYYSPNVPTYLPQLAHGHGTALLSKQTKPVAAKRK